ncbi:hypothetical protein ASD8599_03149 [Ascidiaceihabitans donghaensis]|uniref:ABC3 transporter permease C-terminal domain-containing protein n=1 Tax=Ascidiaceihabitans donghaensis TaxID=1510460 RepID=A0A2R8BGZ7_9RHOB|nr:FtsX-like permease family protein [Ascidiaceihabitans donghaensis]SPH22406.1 hypothetical protein ASD8599_03149 [Ascidiaceihabitans donghaensis]
MTAAGFHALWSHWRRNPLQLFTLVAGLALATALWSGVQAVNAEARASYGAAAATLGEGQFDQLLPAQSDSIAQADYIALRRAGWQVGPVVDGRLDADGTQIRILGIDPLTAPNGFGAVGEGQPVDLVGFLSKPTVFANADTADLLQSLGLRVIEDAGVASGMVITDVSVAQDILTLPGQLSRLVIANQQPLGVPPLADVVPNLTRIAAHSGTDVARLTDSFHLNLTAFGLLSFAVGIFIVHGTIGLAFEQRRSMVRTLRALGMPLRRVMVLMGVELIVLALIGGGVGVVMGYLIAAALLPDVAATLKGLYGADVSGTLQLRPSWWISGLLISVAGTGVAAIGSLMQVARMPLLASARPQAWVTASSARRILHVAVSGLLLAVAVALGFWGKGLVLGFVMLGALLIGAALALPLILDVALRLGQARARHVIWEWFWADTRQQLPGLSLALMALLLAMAANVGVSTMVSSFRLTFVGFLDQRLASELYVTAQTPAQSEALQAFLKPQVRVILPVLSVQTDLAGLPTDLYGARIDSTHRNNWAFLEARSDAWDSVDTGRGIIINEQLARRAGLWVGDDVPLGGSRSLPVVGIYGDYGNPIGQAIVQEDLFNALHPNQIPTRFGLRTDTPNSVRKALIDDFGLPEANIIDQAGIKAFSLSIFERTFTVTGALNVLTLAVAGFAIFMSLLTLASMRVPQLAPAWALGLTRRKLGQLELTRAAILAVLTATAAIPLGLALAWVLLAVVNVEAFGWKLPMYVFPAAYAKLCGFALLAAIVAALWPALRLARTPPTDLLKVFANER